MKNLNLRPISILDIDWLDKTEYKNLSNEKRKRLIKDSEQFSCNGEFFRFFLITVDNVVVGVININGHGKSVVSVAPYIIEGHRNNGYAVKSLNLAYKFVKEKGFKELTAGIREENLASQNLHLKLGFNFVKDFLSKNGNKIKIYSKKL